jgi:hypothetical protein
MVAGLPEQVVLGEVVPGVLLQIWVVLAVVAQMYMAHSHPTATQREQVAPLRVAVVAFMEAQMVVRHTHT